MKADQINVQIPAPQRDLKVPGIQSPHSPLEAEQIPERARQWSQSSQVTHTLLELAAKHPRMSEQCTHMGFVTSQALLKSPVWKRHI